MGVMLINKGDNNGQRWHSNRYCPSCHVFGNIPHVNGCKDRKVRISATARIPRKGSSKKVWDRFYDKFVLQTELKEHFRKKSRRSKWVKELETMRIRRDKVI